MDPDVRSGVILFAVHHNSHFRSLDFSKFRLPELLSRILEQFQNSTSLKLENTNCKNKPRVLDF